MKKVSIIMGIYNCEDTLEDAIESIINQTYGNWELIMCDDASTDNTYKVAKLYEEQYKNKIIVLRNKKNMKLSFTLNRCLKVATGELVARMDADDVSKPVRLEKQVKFLNENKEFSLVGSNVKIFDESSIKGERKLKEIPNAKDLYSRGAFAHPTIMTYKFIYDKLNGYTVSKRTEKGQDLDLWIRFFSKGYRGYNIQESLLNYRESKDEVLKKRTLKSSSNFTKTLLKGVKPLKLPVYYYIISWRYVVVGMIPAKLRYFINVFFLK